VIGFELVDVGVAELFGFDGQAIAVGELRVAGKLDGLGGQLRHRRCVPGLQTIADPRVGARARPGGRLSPRLSGTVPFAGGLRALGASVRCSGHAHCRHLGQQRPHGVLRWRSQDG
jgi:hypothetical protein